MLNHIFHEIWHVPGYQYIPGTMRQTLVLVIPFCKYFNQFSRYEKVIQAINQARKNTLDLMTEAAFEKLMGDASGFVDMIVKNV